MNRHGVLDKLTPTIAVRTAEFGRSYTAYALGLIVVVGVFNIVDRSIVGLLLQPIAQDLHLTDTQLGLFSGPAFGIFFSAETASRVLRHLAQSRGTSV